MPYPTAKYFVAQTWVPVTVYNSSSDDQLYFIIYDVDGFEIGGHSIFGNETGLARQFFMYIPELFEK